jgi:hypothetical protein
MPLPPLLVKGTIVFDGVRHGWTESYWWISSVDDLNPNADFLGTVVPKRAKMLGTQSGIQAYRVSFETDAAGNPVLGDSVLRYITQPGNADPDWSNDEEDVGVLATWRNLDAKRRKNQFVRGTPDAIDVENGRFDTGLAGWQSAWNAWVGVMVGKPTGWVTRTKVKVVAVTGYSTDPDSGQVVYTVPAGTFGAGPYKQQVVRVAGLNTQSVLNKQQIVLPTSDTEAHTVKPIAAGPFVTQGKMTTYDFGFVACANIYAQKIVTRRVGAPLLVSHGRRKARPLT